MIQGFSLVHFLFFTATVIAAPLRGKPIRLRVGETYSVRAPAGLNGDIRWFQAVPIIGNYDNRTWCIAHPGPGCHQPIQYHLEEVKVLAGKRSFSVQDVPLFLKAGAYRLIALPAQSSLPREANVEDEKLSAALVFAIRENDSYVGNLTELIGTPFVLWPRFTSPGEHQTDALIGADCVATVIYGRRQLGCEIPYVGPSGLYRFAKPIPKGSAGYRISEGDILHFGFQTAVIAKDNPPIGVLDDSDEIIHSYHGLVERVPFGELPYRKSTFEVLRWKDDCERHVAFTSQLR